MAKIDELFQATIDEQLYLIPDPAKLTISAVKANSAAVDISALADTLVIVQPLQGNTLSQAGEESLRKLILALKQPEDKIQMITIADDIVFSMRDIRRMPDIKRVVIIGTAPETLGLYINYKLYKILKYNNIDILISNSIEDISLENKKVLWTRLQTMFGLV